MSDRRVMYRVKTADGRVLDVLERSPLTHNSVGWHLLTPGDKFAYGGTDYEFVERVAS